MRLKIVTKEIPPIARGRKPRRYTSPNAPFLLELGRLEVGQCLEVRYTAQQLKEASIKKRYNRIQFLLSGFRKKSGLKLTTRTNPFGFDVFRTA